MCLGCPPKAEPGFEGKVVEFGGTGTPMLGVLMGPQLPHTTRVGAQLVPDIGLTMTKCFRELTVAEGTKLFPAVPCSNLLLPPPHRIKPSSRSWRDLHHLPTWPWTSVALLCRGALGALPASSALT